jgi:hypothetical protein
MTIYHGSTVPVEVPKIVTSNRKLDFGEGFYATSNKEQAIIWAEIVSARRGDTARFLSIYHFEYEKAVNELEIIRFHEPDEAWLDFVCTNRSGQTITEPYDIVFGPVANDRVYRVVQFYENGVYDKHEAIRRLKVDKLLDQILFHTEKSLEYCRFIEYKDLGVMV